MRKFYKEIGLRKVRDRYYVCLCSDDEGRSFLPIEGEEVTVEDFPEHEFFAFRYENVHPPVWGVCDALTGLLIARGSTKEEAVILARKKLLEKGKMEHEATIVERIYVNGVLSPRYEKEGSNKGRCVRCGTENVERTHAGYCYPCAYIDPYKRLLQIIRARRERA